MFYRQGAKRAKKNLLDRTFVLFMAKKRETVAHGEEGIPLPPLRCGSE
jgi:hypothetical protein